MPRASPTCLATVAEAPLEPRRALDLVVPVEAHVFDDAVRHDDDAAFLPGIGEVLMHGEGRDVDVIADRPFELLRRLGPLPVEGFEAIPLQVPVQVVAGA